MSSPSSRKEQLPAGPAKLRNEILSTTPSALPDSLSRRGSLFLRPSDTALLEGSDANSQDAVATSVELTPRGESSSKTEARHGNASTRSPSTAVSPWRSLKYGRSGHREHLMLKRSTESLRVPMAEYMISFILLQVVL
ncbi:hypothetical protein ACA910_020493 [Epithemia clementina (nom. ined.)]